MSKPTMPPSAVAALLSKAGGVAISEESIERDVASGAPADEDGSVNLIEYAAWLLRQVRDRP